MRGMILPPILQKWGLKADGYRAKLTGGWMVLTSRQPPVHCNN